MTRFLVMLTVTGVLASCSSPVDTGERSVLGVLADGHLFERSSGESANPLVRDLGDGVVQINALTASPRVIEEIRTEVSVDDRRVTIRILEVHGGPTEGRIIDMGQHLEEIDLGEGTVLVRVFSATKDGAEVVSEVELDLRREPGR